MLMVLSFLLPVVGAVLVFREKDNARRRRLTVLTVTASAVLAGLTALPEAGTAEKDLTATAAIILLACGVLFLGVCFTPVMNIIVRGLELM